MDALKNFMSTMTDTIMQQVSEQVKKALEAASYARPLPRFDYMPSTAASPPIGTTPWYLIATVMA